MTPRDIDQILAKLTGLGEAMAAVVTKVDGLTERRRDSDRKGESQHSDHESRIRALEAAGQRQGRFSWGDALRFAGSLCTAIIAWKALHG